MITYESQSYGELCKRHGVDGCNLAAFGMVGNLALITPIPNAAIPESRISNSGSTTTPGSPFPPTTSRSFAQTHQTAIIEPSACD